MRPPIGGSDDPTFALNIVRAPGKGEAGPPAVGRQLAAGKAARKLG
jgi:hypothetical protein